MVTRLVALKKREQIGVAVLASSGSFSIWSALNTSPFTIHKFSGNEEDRKVIRTGMKIALGVTLLISAGIGLAFGREGVLAGVANAGVGVGLYAYYDHVLKKQEAVPLQSRNDVAIF